MIRDLRAKLAQLMRELRAVQADDSMNPEARRIRLQQIQAQMSALNGALIKAGLVDEWVAYMAPMAVGDAARGLFAHPALTSLDQAARFRLGDVRQIGGDLRLTLLPA